MKGGHKLLMRTCVFPKSNEPTSIHNSYFLSRKRTSHENGCISAHAIPMATPPSVNVSIVLTRTVRNMREKNCTLYQSVHEVCCLCMLANFQSDHFQTAGYGSVLPIDPCGA